jgi:hypothetical protein
MPRFLRPTHIFLPPCAALILLGCLGGGGGNGGGGTPSTFQIIQTVDGIKREEGINLEDATKETTMITTDSMGAIGPNYVVQMVNFRIAIFDRRTTPMTRVREATLAEFFKVDRYPEGFVVGDPRIIYDPLSRRWFACGMDRPTVFKNNRILLAVSTDADPVPLDGGTNLTDRSWITAKWKKYYLKGNETNLLADYPCLGLDANGVYIATSLFDYYGGSSVSTRKLVAIPKAPLLAGTDILEQPASDSNVFNLPISDGGYIIQPAHSYEPNPPGNIAWMLSKADTPTPRPRYRPGPILYGKLRWNAATGIFQKEPGWFSPGGALAVPANLSYWDVPPNRVPFEAPQKSRYGLTAGVPVGHTSTHVMSAVLRNNFLWICQHVGFNANGGYTGSGAPPDRSGIVWFKFIVGRADPSNPSLAHTAPPSFARIWDPGSSPKWYYYPTLAVNDLSDVLVGFSGSNADEFISAYFQGWTGSFTEGPKLIQSGRDYFTFGASRRWTDYTATAFDPFDFRSFCTFQPYTDLEPGGPFELEGIPRWGTAISIIKVQP